MPKALSDARARAEAADAVNTRRHWETRTCLLPSERAWRTAPRAMHSPARLAAALAGAAALAAAQSAPPTAAAAATSPACPIGLSPASPAASCDDLFRTCGLTDGVYWLRPALDTYAAHCADDGWTAALAVDGTQSTFTYDSPLWTNDALLNSNASQWLSASQAKLAPFLDHPVTHVRLRMTAGGASGAPLTLSVGSAGSLAQLFAGGYVATAAPLAEWIALVPGGASYQGPFSQQGINNVFPGNAGHNLRFRVGVMFDNTLDGANIDSGLGLGAVVVWSGPWAGTAGNFAPCCHGQYGGQGYNVQGAVYGSGVVGSFHLFVKGPASSRTATVSVSATATATSTTTDTATGTASSSATGSMTATATASASTTAAATRSPTLSPSTTPGCAPALFRPLPRADLVGEPLLADAAPLAAASEAACRVACCAATAPRCDGYAFAASELRWGSAGSCFLYGAVTATAPNSGYASGLRAGVALPGAAPSPSSAQTPLHGGGAAQPPRGVGSVTPTPTATVSGSPTMAASASVSASAPQPSPRYRGVTFSPTDFFPVMASPHAALWRLRAGLTMPDMGGPDFSPAGVIYSAFAGVGNSFWRYPFAGRHVEAGIIVTRDGFTTGGGQFVIPARPLGTILLHPGDANELPQLQWIAPENGHVTISGLVYPIDVFPLHNAGINVFLNSRLLVRVNCVNTAVPFSVAANVIVGDVITLGIDNGDNGANSHDTTGLDAAISYVHPSESRTPSHSPSPSPTPTPTPYCAPALFRPLPRTDLVGVLVGTAHAPGALSLQPSVEACRQACCDAPACDGFAFSVGDLAITSVGAAGCYLYVNVTQLVPSSGYASGMYESAL